MGGGAAVGRGPLPVSGCGALGGQTREGVFKWRRLTACWKVVEKSGGPLRSCSRTSVHTHGRVERIAPQSPIQVTAVPAHPCNEGGRTGGPRAGTLVHWGHGHSFSKPQSRAQSVPVTTSLAHFAILLEIMIPASDRVRLKRFIISFTKTR